MAIARWGLWLEGDVKLSLLINQNSKNIRVAVYFQYQFKQIINIKLYHPALRGVVHHPVRSIVDYLYGCVVTPYLTVKLMGVRNFPDGCPEFPCRRLAALAASSLSSTAVSSKLIQASVML